jgi:hypothetical protein
MGNVKTRNVGRILTNEESTMDSAETNSRPRGSSNISKVQAGFGPKKLKAPVLRRALTKAAVSALLLATVSPTSAQTKNVNATAEVSGGG